MIRASFFFLILSALSFAAAAEKPEPSVNDTSSCCTLDITTNPEAASIYFARDTTLASYNEMERAKMAAELASTSEETNANDGSLGWRGWTRILAFTAAAGLGTVAVLNHLDAKENENKLNKKNTFEKHETNRTYFGAGACVFAVAGTLTFFF